MVALSIEILAPMLQLGWATACSGVTEAISARENDRNGPPEAVRMIRATRSGRSPANTWKIAECSESTGITAPPAARARSSRAGPQHTRLSLLARARVAPLPAAAQAGRRPAAPTAA